MSKFTLNSAKRSQRTVMVAPSTDRWIEREAARWGVSYSEAANRLLQAHHQGQEAGERDTDHRALRHLLQILLEGCEARLTDQVARLQGAVAKVHGEVENIKSNLHLLQILQDRAVAKTLTPRQYDEWREEARGMLAKRQGGKG